MQDAALPRSLATLCSLWLGGDTGMRPTAVARTLEVPRYRINTAVGRFAAGGVVDGARQASPWSSDEDGIGEGYLVVRPPSLRYALVRGVSFSSLQVMPLDELIEAAPDTTEVARTLVRATGYGASVPPDLLTTLLERANSAEAWDEYAALGKAAATYVLTNHPENTAAVADSALERAPRVSPYHGSWSWPSVTRGLPIPSPITRSASWRVWFKLRCPVVASRCRGASSWWR